MCRHVFQMFVNIVEIKLEKKFQYLLLKKYMYIAWASFRKRDIVLFSQKTGVLRVQIM